MSADAHLVFTNPPIVEAVIDIDCDLPADLDFGSLEERAKETFTNDYPVLRRQLIQEQELKLAEETPPEFSARTAIAAFQFRTADGHQLVQVRRPCETETRQSQFER